ncbi:UNVERIFIED_CONTAM: hypothetical protein HDU68_002044 [Siphonaria sp. JEL0065]|nr:hypothetical protein HDU68_002044 [Siphonaria sp. JEL0065]
MTNGTIVGIVPGTVAAGCVGFVGRNGVYLWTGGIVASVLSLSVVMFAVHRIKGLRRIEQVDNGSGDGPTAVDDKGRKKSGFKKPDRSSVVVGVKKSALIGTVAGRLDSAPPAYDA